MTKVNRDRQIGLFNDAPPASPPVERPASAPQFIDPDPNEIYIGSERLSSHLRAMGVRDALVVREVLREANFEAFDAHYSGQGRPGYAPASMAGIVLYGLMHGVSSLRELERFARVDLGCMWVSGGNTPDHSVLGRFIGRHEVELGELLFAEVVTSALARTGSTTQTLAGDGTVIEAMSSRYGVLQAEAAQARLSVLDERSKDNELSEAEAAEAAQLQAMTETLDERRARYSGRGHQRLNPSEPDAAVLKQKDGQSYRSSYVPVVLANEARVVVDAEVDSTHELAPMATMLVRQAETTDELLLDAGYRAESLLESAIAQDVSVLLPAQGGEPGQRKWHEKKQHFPIGRFRYDEVADVYHCPAGEVLKPTNRYRKQRRVRYTSKACVGCPLHDQCTKAKRRIIERTRATELREGLAQVMAQPQAKARYAKRKAWVEPVFSSLRGGQGLNRFRRSGLAKVRLEFRLHVMAYNLSRVVAWLSAAFSPVLVTLKAHLGHFSRWWRRRNRHPVHAFNGWGVAEIAA
jgi:transposase